MSKNEKHELQLQIRELQKDAEVYQIRLDQSTVRESQELLGNNSFAIQSVNGLQMKKNMSPYSPFKDLDKVTLRNASIAEADSEENLTPSRYQSMILKSFTGSQKKEVMKFEMVDGNLISQSSLRISKHESGTITLDSDSKCNLKSPDQQKSSFEVENIF